MKTSLLAATIITASLFTTSANAQESYITSMLNNMVKYAVTVSSSELKADAVESIANTTYHFSLDESTSTGKVSISDIAETKVDESVTASSDEE
ncbi:hypothetical protein GTH32_15445 [Alteromonas sp. 345S023]|uniref:Uncharacterized protein n=1 Tax=Alteromonas profundi TaxID=2696062 RepID=A0A7X5RLZ6_9ALTE|nr:hypothetical protein [Alteromonas profundi]NDV92568.1 hypothetical protein [Alteromonas profundi]